MLSVVNFEAFEAELAEKTFGLSLEGFIKLPS